jgi:hypothetical protein
MPTDTFWSNPGRQTPPQSVITLNSKGDLQPGPMGQIPGTSAGAIPTAYVNSARDVYPWDFDFNATDRVAEYNALVTRQFAQFSSWHSLYQARYISQLPNGQKFVSIPPNPGPNAPDAYYILLADNRTVLNVMSVTLADYQRLSPLDRSQLEGVAPFMNFVVPTLGLDPKWSARNTIPGEIANLRNSINGASTMPPSDQDVFRRQLALIEARYSNTALVAIQTVQTEIGALAERFKRALAFSNIRDEVGIEVRFNNYHSDGDLRRSARFTTDVRGYVISSDNGQTARSGYQAFMRAEREILSAQLRRDAISRSSNFYDPKMDAAQLIYQLQLLYQSEAEARGDGGTEEMAQLHRLLSDYAVMQRLVNETLKAYNPKVADEKRRFLNLGAQANGNVQQDWRAQSAADMGGRNNVTYQTSDNRTISVYPPNAPSNRRWFDHAPAYHWYMLAGTPGNARISSDIVMDDEEGEPFDSNDSGNDPAGEVYNIYGPDEDNVVIKSGGLSPEEMRIIAMFSDDPWGSGAIGSYQRHPIEIIYDVQNRPRQKLSDDTNEGYGSLTLQRRDYWDKWSTQLADTVTILNQKNQLKQNEIDNDSKQANRHFDLGTNALRKMNEMLMSIGRM